MDTCDHSMGIWTQMNSNASLVVEGHIPTSTDITYGMELGWATSWPSLLGIQYCDNSAVDH